MNALKLAEEWKDRADDCGRLARAILALSETAPAAFKLCDDCQQSSDCLHFSRCFRALSSPSATVPTDPGTEKILRTLLDRAYKMNLMAIPSLRVSPQDADHNDPLVAWMADVRRVLYGSGRQPDVGSLT